MAVLYLTDQGATVHKQGGSIVVRKLGRRLHSIHAFNLEQVVVFGRVHLTPQLIHFLLEENIDTVFMSTAGRFRGRLVSGEGRNIELRRAQFRRGEDPAFELDLARRFVRGKLQNSRALVRRHQRTGPHPDLEAALHRIRHALTALDRAATLDEVRGWEGAGAAAYFGCMPHMIQAEGFSFEGRSRRPPRDAFNALLSFGYTMLLGTITSAVQTVGLDAYLGSLHATENGKPSLVLDLMEEFRPLLVDALALRAVNRRQIVPADFLYRPDVEVPEAGLEGQELTRDDYPVLLGREGMRKWILLYEAGLRRTVTYPRLGVQLTYRSICLEQARLLARHILGQEPYEPFCPR